MKKTLGKLLAAATLVLTLATPSLAVSWDNKLAFIASRIPECNAAYMDVVKTDYFNGAYAGDRLGRMLGYNGPAIRVWTEDDTSPWTTAILLHEIGHCVQWAQSNTYYTYEVKYAEFDADRRGIEYAIQLGENPSHVLDLLVYVQQKYNLPANYPTDHGSFNERILHAQHVIRKVQAPETP